MAIRYVTVREERSVEIRKRPPRRVAKPPARAAPAPGVEDAALVITPRQISAARALLGWSQQQLADSAGISRATLMRIEAGAEDTKVSSLRAIEAVLAKVEMEIVPPMDGKGEGLRFANPPHARPDEIAPPKPPPKKQKAVKGEGARMAKPDEADG